MTSLPPRRAQGTGGNGNESRRATRGGTQKNFSQTARRRPRLAHPRKDSPRLRSESVRAIWLDTGRSVLHVADGGSASGVPNVNVLELVCHSAGL
jgi:hypothetical protein